MIIGILLLSFLMGQPVWAAVQNGEKYDIATNEISGWPKGPEIYSETGVLMKRKRERFSTTAERTRPAIQPVSPR